MIRDRAEVARELLARSEPRTDQLPFFIWLRTPVGAGVEVEVRFNKRPNAKQIRQLIRHLELFEQWESDL